MTNTKLHINLQQGVLEVEGQEAFVREIYAEFKDQLVKASSTSSSGSSQKLNTGVTSKAKPANINGGSSSKKRKRGKTDEPKVDKDLDLSGVNNISSLKDFYAQYSPKSNMEKNVVFIQYLKEQMEIEGVSLDHVWTCYYHMNMKYPGNPQQSLYDTSAKGWVNVPSLEELSVSIHGKNWLREQLNKDEAA